MSMSNFKTIFAYLATGTIFLGIDLVWLAIMTPRLYKPQLAAYMADKFNLLPALLFYVLFTVALMLLVVLPAVERGSILRALVLGGLLGLAAYATYDLTNLASVKNWPVIISVVDIAWGTTLSAISATLGYLITKALS
jgi:uncharacterized membrane protein